MSTASASSPSGIGVNLVFIGMIILAAFAAVALIGNAAAVASAAEAAVPVAEIVEEPEADQLAVWVAVLPEIEITGTHADEKHPEAPLVRQTCRERGVYQVWRERYAPDTFHILCMMPDGKLVDWIVRQVGKRLIERTAFIPRAGIAVKVIEYAASKGTRWTGGLLP
jgi:hypothetical protein